MTFHRINIDIVIVLKFINKYRHPERWSIEFGDRLNELVMIGINLNEEQVRNQMLHCICTDEEIMIIQSGMFDTNDDFSNRKTILRSW